MKSDPSLDRALVDALKHPVVPPDASDDLLVARAWLAGSAVTLGELPVPMALAAVTVAEERGLGALLASQDGLSSKDLRKAIARSIHRLRSRGEKVPASETARVYRFQSDESSEHRSAHFNRLEGGWALILTTSIGAQDDRIVSLTLDAAGGFVSLEGAHVPEGRARSFARDVTRDPRVTSLPFIAGLTLALRAIDRWAKPEGLPANDAPLQWVEFVQSLPESTVQAARILNPWRDLEQEFDPATIETDSVPAENDPHDWCVEFEDLQLILAQHITARLERRENDENEPSLDDTLPIREWLADPANIDSLSRVFDLAALASHYSGNQAVSLPIRRTALALRAGVEPSRLAGLTDFEHFCRARAAMAILREFEAQSKAEPDADSDEAS